jgi:hypothetical protein
MTMRPLSLSKRQRRNAELPYSQVRGTLLQQTCATLSISEATFEDGNGPSRQDASDFGNHVCMAMDLLGTVRSTSAIAFA